MRYISHYEEYAIYEPAEGGYYYPGNELVSTERLSKRACKKKFREICAELEKEEPGAWCIEENSARKKYSGKHHYIGTGESYVIERRSGSQEKGWKPYC